MLTRERAAAALAKLQIDSIDHGTRILGAGARDLGSPILSRLIQPFMETMAELMKLQTKVSPVALGREELLLLGDRIQGALDALEALGIPETLGHLDLNPGPRYQRGAAHKRASAWFLSEHLVDVPLVRTEEPSARAGAA